MEESQNYAIITEDKLGNIRFLSGFGEKSTYENSVGQSKEIDARVIFNRFGLNHVDYQFFIQNIGQIHGKKASDAQNELKSLIDKIKE